MLSVLPRKEQATAVLIAALALTLPGAGRGQAAADESASASRPVMILPIPGVIAADSRWQLAWQGTNNADGLVALPDGTILFAQEQPGRIGRLDATDNYSIYMEGTRGVGSLALDSRGQVWGVERSCTDPGRQAPEPCTEPTAIVRLTPERFVLADNVAGRPLGRLNDLTIDPRGGAWFTVGGLFRAHPDGQVVETGSGLRTNGVALSPDGTVLYVTNREEIVAFALDAAGAAGPMRHFATLQAGGTGDGMTVDTGGRVYVTSQPGVQVFTADGAYLGVIPTPRPAISVAFGGPGKRRLYVVGSGAALGPDGGEYLTPAGVRNNAKTIYRIEMLAAGPKN